MGVSLDGVFRLLVFACLLYFDFLFSFFCVITLVVYLGGLGFGVGFGVGRVSDLGFVGCDFGVCRGVISGIFSFSRLDCGG